MLVFSGSLKLVFMFALTGNDVNCAQEFSNDCFFTSSIRASKTEVIDE